MLNIFITICMISFRYRSGFRTVRFTALQINRDGCVCKIIISICTQKVFVPTWPPTRNFKLNITFLYLAGLQAIIRLVSRCILKLRNE